VASNPPRLASPLERASEPRDRSPAPRIDLWFARYSAALAAKPALAIALSIALVLSVGVIDYLTVARISVLYVMPVAVATWTRGRMWGALTSMLSVMVWGIAFRTQTYPQHDPYFVWDCVALGVTLLLFGELLARLRVALARSDDRFVRVLSGLHAAVFVSDEHGVLFANEWLARMLDGSHAPMPGEIAARFPIDVTGTAGLSDTPAHLPFTGHEVRDAIDGRWYLAQAGAITWTDGRRVRLTVLTDITEQKRAAALQRENQAALHHTARLVNLAEAGTTLAHELNQPLVAIVGYNSACLRLLDSGNADPGELATAMEKCRAQAVRAGEILRRIRELTRKRAPTLAPNDVNATVQKVLGWVQDELDRDGVRVTLSLDRSLPTAQADAILVEQVVLNLVNNAVDAMRNMPAGQRELLIQTEAEERSAVRVTVGDRGGGIAPEHEPHVFTPFFTTKERGLGLGLSICRSVIEMHGGRLWHDRRPGGGAAFHFSLPTGAP
jgi:signal transduction histidine kinase